MDVGCLSTTSVTTIAALDMLRYSSLSCKDCSSYLYSSEEFQERHGMQCWDQAQVHEHLIRRKLLQQSGREKPHCGRTNQLAITQTPCNLIRQKSMHEHLIRQTRSQYLFQSYWQPPRSRRQNHTADRRGLFAFDKRRQ